jgi:hypothetical protein
MSGAASANIRVRTNISATALAGRFTAPKWCPCLAASEASLIAWLQLLQTCGNLFRLIDLLFRGSAGRLPQLRQ